MMYLHSANDYYLTRFMTFGFTCLRSQNCEVNGEKKEYSYNMLIRQFLATKENRMKKTLGVSCYVTHSRLTLQHSLTHVECARISLQFALVFAVMKTSKDVRYKQKYCRSHIY